MRIKILNIVFAVIFVSMLIVPLVFLDPEGGIASEQENRMLAARPTISDLTDDPRGFIRLFDNWFTDNTGFRPDMISLYKQLDRLETQGQYANGDYINLIGREGHHYFAGYEGILIMKYQGKFFLGDDVLEEFAASLDEARTYLEDRDIPFTMMICTDKESVYPEYYPESIIRGPGPALLDTVTDYLKENTEIDIFNTKECLLAEKENYYVYNKSAGDVGHWNEVGAFFVYRELMKHIGAYIPGTEPLTIDDIDIVYSEDGIPCVTLKQDVAYKKLGPDFFDGVPMDRPFSWENVAYFNDDTELPTILFMCDSFGETFCKYIPQQFGKTIMIHYKNMEFFKEYCELYEPDIVVLEVAERQLTWAPEYIYINEPPEH